LECAFVLFDDDFAALAATRAGFAVELARVAGFVEIRLANAVATVGAARAVGVAAVHSAEVLAVVAVFELVLDEAVAAVRAEVGACVVAVSVLAGVLARAVIAELEAGANPVATGVAALGVLGDEPVEGQREVRLGRAR